MPDRHLVSVFTRDGLRLRGLFVPPQASKPTIVHVHGNCGNFYENAFLDYMADIFGAAGLGFLMLNNRGHDVLAEAYKHGGLTYIGSAVERYEESLFDLEGGVEFAQRESSSVFLQGHSFGCTKVLNYLVEARSQVGAILLSPADSIRLQRDYVAPETLEEQIRRLRRYSGGRRECLIPSGEFGIREGNCEYEIPISLGSFLDLFEGEFTRVTDYSQPPNCRWEGAAFIYCGGSDPLLTASLDDIREHFSRRFDRVEFYSEADGDHHMKGFEDVVARRIVAWVLGEQGLA